VNGFSSAPEIAILRPNKILLNKAGLIMKKLLGLITVTLLAGFAWGESYEEQVRERLAPAGNVCIQGEECAAATMVAEASQSSGSRSGEDVYGAACAACHNSGVLSAPVLGDAGQWSARLEQDTATLYDHAINGIGSMPAKGGNASLSDEEVQAAVDHMIAAVQ
jgi:cytochrome c5